MGMLIAGKWSNRNLEVNQGRYTRADSVYAGDIPAEVSREFRSSPGRYHLIASMSCQWSQRALILRRLTGLQDCIPLQIAHGARVQGYAIDDGRPWRVPGGSRSIRHLHQLYSISDAGYSGSVTLPLLWDSLAQRILSNESAKIVRAFDAAPAAPGSLNFTLLPEALRGEIEKINHAIHVNLSNAVYQVGFAQSQTAYDEALARVFDQLDELETRLSTRRYLCGEIITEADIRLFSTLIRFDDVYHILHRCSRRRLIDYAALFAYAREIYGWVHVTPSVDFDTIREACYLNDTANNPHRIVAAASDCDWRAAHHRERLGAAFLLSREGEKFEVDPTRWQAISG